MAQIQKFTYALIIFLSMFLLVTYISCQIRVAIIIHKAPCHRDEDCDVQWPCELPNVSKCIDDFCDCVLP
ncbi:unnamed protein product [Trifolium pratense]|nr:unnamed protein product [Trifolium pratense]